MSAAWEVRATDVRAGLRAMARRRITADCPLFNGMENEHEQA